MSKVWLITGAGRGMGVDIAKAALAVGNRVVATGRNTDKVAQAVGKSADLFVVKLDVTKPTDAESAVKASVDKFGRIDVLVNNAANFYAGFFEELLPEQMERQLSTSLMGPMNVTRAVLPVMRKQRSGLIITISSTAGLIGFEFGTSRHERGEPNPPGRSPCSGLRHHNHAGPPERSSPGGLLWRTRPESRPHRTHSSPLTCADALIHRIFQDVLHRAASLDALRAE